MRSTSPMYPFVPKLGLDLEWSPPVTRAELSFLLPLFDLAGSLVDSDDVENMTMGLGEIDERSPLAHDDSDLQGMWVSMVVHNGIGACLDHVVALRDLVTRDHGRVTLAAPWTLLRAAVEACAASAWVLAPSPRRSRQARALRVWHHDFTERQKWETDTGRTPPVRGQAGSVRATEVVALATSLGIDAKKVSTALAYSDIVANAASTVGWDHNEARARWREASAFAHGRTWPLLSLTSPTCAQLIRGGVGVSLTLNESLLEPLARLTYDVLNGSLLRYAELAGSRTQTESSSKAGTATRHEIPASALVWVGTDQVQDGGFTVGQQVTWPMSSQMNVAALTETVGADTAAQVSLLVDYDAPTPEDTVSHTGIVTHIESYRCRLAQSHVVSGSVRTHPVVEADFLGPEMENELDDGIHQGYLVSLTNFQRT